MKTLRLILVMTSIAVPLNESWAIAYEVGEGSEYRDPASFAWSQLRPGDRVHIRDGSYANRIIIGAHGTEAAPIEITSDKQAILSTSLILDGARFVILSDLQVAGAEGAGFVLSHGARQNTLRRVSVRKSGLGVLIMDGAGPGNVVERGTFVENITHGIAVDRVNATKSLPGVFRDNFVSGNGYHGIDIYGSYYRVERNRVSGNGGGIAGTSGIHVFARDRFSGYGSHNLVRGNAISGQIETTGRDGNGIQLDTWCDHNEVVFNLAFGNDGPGVNLYDASLNLVTNNTLVGNMQRADSAHLLRGELVIASDEELQLDHARNNIVANNLIVVTDVAAAGFAIHRSIQGAPAAFSGNLIWRTGPGPIAIWAGQAIDSIDAWNRRRPGYLDRRADPGFDLTIGSKSRPPSVAFRPSSNAVLAGFRGLPAAGARDLQNTATQPGLTGALMPVPAR